MPHGVSYPKSNCNKTFDYSENQFTFVKESCTGVIFEIRLGESSEWSLSICATEIKIKP